MRYRVAVEDIEPSHYVAWALDLPGCFSRAPTAEEAIAFAPRGIADYFRWVSHHDPALPSPSDLPTAEVVEVFQSFRSRKDPDYFVNAFFTDDRRPLAHWDIVVALNLLLWSREDLMTLIESLPHGRLQESIPGQGRKSIVGVLEHVAGAENWYLSQLGMGLGQSQLPADALEKLRSVRDHARAQLPKLIGDDRITESREELWSGRKVVRRMLWHERAHTGQIVRLSNLVGHE